ncbi:DNA-processing protein DprA [Candidatus Parcubacteria bacterium]|nr:DNA-processing protein DprA [Candidatus Parcubacteria bacterium]
MNDLKYLIALNNFPKFGPVRLKRLKKHFPDQESAFKSSANELIKAGIESKIADEFTAARININPDQLLEQLNQEGINVITIENKNYPKLLAEIYDPPQLLYYKGQLETQDEFALAVVGTRKYTNYGKQVAEQIVKDLARNNLTIVSGLALGIDALSHLAALEVKGRTIAILGSGLDKQSIYPSANRYIADKIIANNGTVISEFPLGTPPLKHHFPQRNRIISGLSLGTLVIEAGEKSGALITASHALEQNREVFTVPGSIYSPASAGPNQLIKLGAKTVTSAADIIEALDLAQVTAYIDNKKIIPASAEEKKIISHLTHESIHINELVRLTKLDTGIINSTLTIMEMKGMIRNLGGMQYVLAR